MNLDIQQAITPTTMGEFDKLDFEDLLDALDALQADDFWDLPDHDSSGELDALKDDASLDSPDDDDSSEDSGVLQGVQKVALQINPVTTTRPLTLADIKEAAGKPVLIKKKEKYPPMPQHHILLGSHHYVHRTVGNRVFDSEVRPKHPRKACLDVQELKNQVHQANQAHMPGSPFPRVWIGADKVRSEADYLPETRLHTFAIGNVGDQIERYTVVEASAEYIIQDHHDGKGRSNKRQRNKRRKLSSDDSSSSSNSNNNNHGPGSSGGSAASGSSGSAGNSSPGSSGTNPQAPDSSSYHTSSSEGGGANLGDDSTGQSRARKYAVQLGSLFSSIGRYRHRRRPADRAVPSWRRVFTKPQTGHGRNNQTSSCLQPARVSREEQGCDIFADKQTEVAAIAGHGPNNKTSACLPLGRMRRFRDGSIEIIVEKQTHVTAAADKESESTLVVKEQANSIALRAAWMLYKGAEKPRKIDHRTERFEPFPDYDVLLSSPHRRYLTTANHAYIDLKPRRSQKLDVPAEVKEPLHRALKTCFGEEVPAPTFWIGADHVASTGLWEVILGTEKTYAIGKNSNECYTVYQASDACISAENYRNGKGPKRRVETIADHGPALTLSPQKHQVGLPPMDSHSFASGNMNTVDTQDLESAVAASFKQMNISAVTRPQNPGQPDPPGATARAKRYDDGPNLAKKMVARPQNEELLPTFKDQVRFKDQARYVADGHKTEAPATLTYASVVGRETINYSMSGGASAGRID